MGARTLGRIESQDAAPFGTAFLPDRGEGVDLASAGYVEEEWLLQGTAGTWVAGEPGRPRRDRDGIPYATRVLVRRPAEAARASGVVQLEPLHPHRDGGLTWRAAADHVLRSGDTWVGVTAYAHQADALRDRIAPTRYAALSIPEPGLEWDIVADVAELLKRGEVPGVVTRRTILSGWSATGTFVRVFLGEGFAVREQPIVDGAIIFISSGGAGDAGYPPLSPASDAIAVDDPRRTVGGSGIPVFEVLSETESETHEHQVRDDSDDPGDRYRLYMVAGTGHIEPWNGEVLTNTTMLADLGLGSPEIEVLEQRTDARLDLVARAALQRMSDWIDGTPPPRFGRFGYTGPQVDLSRELARDADGNVLGGVRTPWVEAPLAAYRPHGTAAPTAVAVDDGTPVGDPRIAALLTATMAPFAAERIHASFASEAAYRSAFDAATDALLDAGLLLPADAAELRASAADRWRRATG